MHERSYYQYAFTLGREEIYLLWFTNSRDGVLVDQSGAIVGFRSPGSLNAYADQKGIALESTDSSLLDFDRALSWSANPTGSSLDAKLLLDVWNLIDDVRLSLFDLSDASPGPDEDLDLYDKLFWANNPPSLTPEGEYFIPVWRVAELARLSEVIRSGVAIILDNVVVLG